MKFRFKSGLALAVSVLVAVAVHAEMAQRVLRATVVTTATDVATMRGELAGVGVVIPEAFTADVTIVSSEGTTLFSKDDCEPGTNWYYPRVAIHSTAGAALSSSVITYGGADQTTTNTFLTYAQTPTVTITTNYFLTYAQTPTVTITTNELIVYGTGDVAIATNLLLTYSTTWEETITTNSFLTYSTTWEETITTNTLLTFGFSTATAATNAVAEYGYMPVVGDITATFVSEVGTTGTCSVLINYIK